MPTRPTTSKRPGFRYFTTWLPILTGVPGDFRQIGIYRIRRSSGSQGCPCRAGRRPLHRPAERGHVQPSGHGHLAKRLANLYAAMPQPARRLGPRGASPMSTDTITARPAAGAGAARAPRTAFVLAGGITPDLLADTSAGALNATHWLNWRRCYQARTRWYHRRAQLARDGGITLVS